MATLPLSWLPLLAPSLLAPSPGSLSPGSLHGDPAPRLAAHPCRSASRIGESDGDANRKRIKALRVELQKKGWRSVGY